jgi:hypothetical protein
MDGHIAVINVGRCSAHNGSEQVARNNQVGIGAADSLFGLSKGINPARPLQTIATTDTQVAKTALWQLLRIAVVNGFDVLFFGLMQHLNYGRINTPVIGKHYPLGVMTMVMMI